MATIPKTSVALLNAIAASSDSPRWNEFYDIYQPLLEAFLRSGKFKNNSHPLDVDEVIQDAMIAFMGRIKDYKYDPETKGLFHHYLLMIANNKALEFLRKHRRESEKRNNYKDEFDVLQSAGKFTNDDKQLVKIAEIAKHQVLTDNSIKVRDREIFRRTIGGESPETVAEAFGITRNNVDQIKNRLMKRIREVAEALNRAE